MITQEDILELSFCKAEAEKAADVYAQKKAALLSRLRQSEKVENGVYTLRRVDELHVVVHA